MPRWSSKNIEPPNYYIRLKDIRIALGLYVSQMASLADIPEVTYLYYEQNSTVEIRPDAIVRLSLKLDLSVDYLLGLTDIPTAYMKNNNITSYDTVDTTRVREIRLARGITGKAMAEKLDISRGAYSSKELHPEILSFTIVDIIRISNIFDVPTDYLLNITDDTMRHPQGTYRKVPLGVGETRRIKSRLGLIKVSISSADIVKEYCRTHFNVKRIRLEHNLKQDEVAEAIGIKTLTYSIYERNPYRIPSYYLIKLADFYETTVDYLVGRTDEKT